MENTTLPPNRFNNDTDTIAGNLPTTGRATDSKVLLTRLSQFHHSPSSARVATSAAEQRDGIIKAWALLLHVYLVADTVAFAVIGGTGKRQLACSHWPTSGSQGSSLNINPQLTFTTFEADKHHHQVNTAVAFTDVDNGDGAFSYIVQSSEKLDRDLRLYTQHTCVPRKFASALWNTLLEIHSDLSNSALRKWHKQSISATDTMTLRSFLPQTPFSSRVSVLDLWRESVRTAPQAPVVDSWDGSLTYAELDGLTDKLAHRLVAKGVQPGDFVPFAFEKSLWMVVAMLGIIKSGAACVAIDPSQPAARAEEIINQIRANIILVSPLQASKFADMVGDVLSVSSSNLKSDSEQDSPGMGLPRARPEDPAVCIFTSGSTGKPKGIVVQHQALATRLLVDGGALGFRGARCLQFAAASFDIFITDIFTTLTHQGCLCIPSEEDRLFNLPEFCTKHRVSLAIITPSLASMLTPASFPTLNTLVFSGEALRTDVVARWSTQSHVSLYQGYGPAETGSCTIVRIGQRGEVLGPALGNYVCVLVDPNNHNRLVPIGAVGELLVAGSGLLREYIHDPVRTRAAIVDRPAWWSDLRIEETKFYKTGDLLRYSIDTLDGSLEFVGRRDGQVKYHGQRIELGEIEHHLSLFPNVASCMVTLAKDGHLKGQLVAVVHIQGHSDTRHSTVKLAMHKDTNVFKEEINNFLLSRLPGYMIPGKLFVVTNMPFNASMKLDRAVINNWILDMPADHVAVSTEQLSPSDATQLLPHESTSSAIAKLYATIVAGKDGAQRRRFENHDFKLQSGGIDSIQIMSLSMALKEKFGVQIPIAQMLSSKSTIRTIAAIIDPSEGHQQPNSKVIAPSGAEDDIDVLLRSIVLSSENVFHNPDVKHVFLTGSSGYVGIELLRQLLTRTTCQIYALVRGSSETAASDYLILKAVAAGWWTEGYRSRLQIWLGDLSEPQLGLNLAQWSMLQGQGPRGIDAIIHNGAKVHYHMDYDSLKATNVSSTVQLLKAVNDRKKPLHSFVFVSGGQQLSFDDEDDAAILQQALRGTGYARSKATSELLIKRFAEQEKVKARHVQIVKPGFIVGDAELGKANQNDFIWRYIAASVEMAVYDEEIANGWLYLADVSRVSEIILQSVFNPESTTVVKILDGIQFRDIWLLLQDDFGYNIQPVSKREWLFKLRGSVAAKKEKHVMFPLMHMFETDCQPFGVENGPSRPSIGVKEALRANIDQLIESRFFVISDFLLTPPSSVEDDMAPFRDAFDVQSVRTEFPALHNGIVAFNNAAGTAVYQGAIEGTKDYMSALPIEIGLDDPQSQKKTEGLSNKTAELAAFMNADPDEIGKLLLQLQHPVTVNISLISIACG
jgi:amino acid adenylation domain-containing protein/thioester reductase-like protein